MVPFYIGLMKFLGGILCEFLNMYIICQSTTIVDVVKDYVAMGILAEIDNILISTLVSYEDTGNSLEYPKY